MHDQFSFPSCFSPVENFGGDPTSVSPAATKSGQSFVTSVYRTKIAGSCRLITVTWCKTLLAHSLSLSIEGSENEKACKIELRPWHFRRRHGLKQFHIAGNLVDVFWDLRSAKLSGDPEPRSDFYVAVAYGGEVVLLVGDQKKAAFRRSGFPPSMIDAVLMCKKEHVFGKKRFCTRAKFHDKGQLHEIMIECNHSNKFDPEMVMKIDGEDVVRVRHLQWKFRGNEEIFINKTRLEVYYDVHDWLFTAGPRHALFVFKPVAAAPPPLVEDDSSGSCLFLYAWKLE